MASPISRKSIDSHPQKPVIVRRIIDGLSIRQVVEGLIPPVAEMTAYRYKMTVINPILARAASTESILLGGNNSVVPLVPLASDKKLADRVASAVADAPVLSVFRERLEHLNGIVHRALSKAESSVRVATDKDGNQVVVGADLGVLAPLLNQAHKNVEMLGRATGELEPQGGGSVSIQILCPAAGATTIEQMPRISYSDQLAIEGRAEALEIESADEIGVLQG